MSCATARDALLSTGDCISSHTQVPLHNQLDVTQTTPHYTQATLQHIPTLLHQPRPLTQPLSDTSHAPLHTKPRPLHEPLNTTNCLQWKRSTPDLYLEAATRGRLLHERIGLTTYQQRLLTQSWPLLWSTGTNAAFAASIFATLCVRNRRAQQMMQKATSCNAWKGRVDILTILASSYSSAEQVAAPVLQSASTQN